MWGVMEEELLTNAIKQQLTSLDEAINLRICNQIKDNKATRKTSYELDGIPEGLFDDEEEFIAEPIEPKLSTLEVDEYMSEAYDEYLTAEVVLPHGGELARAKVTAHKHDAMGRPIGKKAPSQPMLDTRMYEVEYPDGSTEAIMVNLIAKNLYSQVNAKGHTFSVIKEIVDHHKDGHALSKDNGYILTKSGQRQRKHTTRGWDHLCELGDGMTTWIPLKDLKESMPVQVAEYAIANKIAKELACICVVGP